MAKQLTQPHRIESTSRIRVVELWCAVALALAILPGSASRAAAQTGAGSASRHATQSPQTGYQNLARQSSFTIKVQRNEVLVDVRVYDKKGNPVTDLKQSDFQVYEDGALQKINSFNLENVQELLQAAERNGKVPIINLAKLPRTTPQSTLKQMVQNHRLTVLFFDLSSLQIDDLMRSLKSAQNFIEHQMTPADLVAVVTYSSDLSVVQDFTNDKDALSKAVKGILVGPSSTLASSGTVGNAGGTDSFGNTVVTQDTGDSFTPDETEFNIFNTDEKLAAMQSLAEMLQNVPGRKSVIAFSSGIEQTGVDNELQLEETIDSADRADVSFYTLDARGLVAMPPGGDASSASPSGTAIYSADAVSSQTSSLHSSRDTLFALAADTGGRMFTDLNNFAPAFTTVQKENAAYYLLGYSPTDTRSNGKWRRIKVTLNQRGLRLEARPGYYAPRNFGQFSKADKEQQLVDAMNSPQPFLELPLAIQTAYFLQPDHDYYVVVAAKIPGAEIPFRAKSDIHRTEFDFAWRATDSKGHVVAALDDTLPVKLDEKTYQGLLKSNVLYEGGLMLPPGEYKLKVVAREDQTGKIGTFEEPVLLPAAENGKLELSSVVVSNELGQNGSTNGNRRQRGEEAAKELAVGARSILPSVTRVFRTNQNLYVYLKSYGAKIAQVENKKPGPGNSAASGNSPTFALLFFRNGVQISEAGPYSASVEKSGSANAIYFTRIPLQKFPPGRYVMQVNVLDPAQDQVAFSRIPIAIMPAVSRVTTPTKGG